MSLEMDIEVFMFIGKFSAFSSLAPFFLGLMRFRTISPELRLLLTLTGVSFLCDMASLFHAQLRIGGNYPGDVYRMAEFILLIMIYYIAFDTPKFAKPFFILTIFYILFLISNVTFFQQEKINSYTFVFSSLVFIVLATGFFYKLMKDLPTLEVYRLPMFWISVAVLVYFAGNLFLFTLSHYLVTTMKDNLRVYWTFHNFLNILNNILFTIGFYVSSKPSKNSL